MDILQNGNFAEYMYIFAGVDSLDYSQSLLAMRGQNDVILRQ